MPLTADLDSDTKSGNRASRLRVGQLQEPFAPTEQVLDDLRNGRMVIIVDAEDRENEGDLVIPAQMATPQAINFMATHGRGLICLAMTRARAETLHLSHMVRTNGSRHRTAFTQSIEAREGVSTGISARDRARTIATAIDTTKGASDLVSPGHVFPLIARDGGVLVRAGHTEASVDLARLAGLMPAAVICEIMNADGTMARVPDLLAFARYHQLKVGTIETLISYRLRHERLVRQIAETKVNSCYGGSFDLKVFATTVEPGEHLALIKGDLSQPGPVLVRVHAFNPMTDLIGGGLESGADPVIAKALRAISSEGRGVLVLIMDAGRESISEWIGLRSDQTCREASGRLRLLETGIGSQILKSLGITNMALLTSSALHDYVGVEAFGLSIVETRQLE
ncbi:MAG: 3,4-dihydroxy-2-butanone-4-phosphate synthase [Hyphomicrobium sp.]|nr:MAG: 3,4-dihydroxy-2-butanone-4-phosphate synthase [Hyphomicrobium sp.]MBZ0209806.1 3,4-dihydroxy-2-butanone-4-phosphate synthase [Hyphomicrobium sp.]